MGLNDTVSAERLHIGFFGLRNAGKSSVVNAVTGQKLSLVSEVKGTTTDPVQKAMELLPLGPVVIIDTPGIDDSGDLGKMRVERAIQTLSKTDIAVLVVDAVIGKQSLDESLCKEFRKRDIPYIVVYNKADLLADDKISVPETAEETGIYVSALLGTHIYELKELIDQRIADVFSGNGNFNSYVTKLIKDDLIESNILTRGEDNWSTTPT